MQKRRGNSYQKRVADVNRIYDQHAKSGLSNREIWRRYIYPVYGITERTFYNCLNASMDQPDSKQLQEQGFLFVDFFYTEDERRRSDYYQTHPEGHSGRTDR